MNFGYKQLYIGGELRDAKSGQREDVICPGTDETIASVAWAGKEDALLALSEAEKGFEYWSKLSLAHRTEWMHKLSDAVIRNEDLLRKAMVYEMGKTYAGAWEDIEAVVNGLEFYPGAMRNMHDEIIPDVENTHRHLLVNAPAGVAVAYLAWNFPLLNIGFKIGPALAAGCSIIIKPSELSPLSALVFGEILHEIDFPAGVINFICGPVEDVAIPMTKSKIPKVLTMIGSSRSGRQVIRDSATSIKRISMELGGNAPFIVCSDANIDKAVEIGIALKFGNTGQTCVSPNRFIIHQDVYLEFLEKFSEKARQIKIGFGPSGDHDMGPLVSRRDRDRILQMIEDDVKNGATLYQGGQIPEGKDKGNFLEPTILTDVDQESRCFKEEIFGPVASMLTFETIDEAIAIANNTDQGLASYIFSTNESLIRQLSEALTFGEVQVNGVKYAIYLPHGGIKESGVGYDCSYLALNDYLVKKRITTSL